MSKLSKTNAAQERASREKLEKEQKRDPLFADMDTDLGRDEYQEVSRATPEVVAPPVAQRPPRKLMRPTTLFRSHPSRHEVPMALSPYTKLLVAMAVTRFIDQTITPNGSFENRNANRDLFIVAALQSNNNDVKKAAKVIATQLQGAKVPKPTILATLDALFFNLLKQATFTTWVGQGRALRVEEGLLPDSFFDKLMSRPAPENNEDTDADQHGNHPADHREEGETSPIGLDTDYVEINGFSWQIEDDVPLSRRIVDALEEMRVYFENIRLAYDSDPKERLAFFIEQINGEWVRHNGDVYTTMVAYEQKNNERNRNKSIERELFFQDQARRIASATV